MQRENLPFEDFVGECDCQANALGKHGGRKGRHSYERAWQGVSFVSW